MQTSVIITNMQNVVNGENSDTDKIRALCDAVKDLVNLLDYKDNKNNQKFPLAKQRGIEKLPNFGGARSEFTNWSRRVEVFLGDDMELKKFLKDLRTTNINDKVEDIDFEIDIGSGKKMIEDMVKWYKYNIHAFLMTTTQGTAYSLVDMTDENGFLAWQRLHREYANVTPQGKRTLLGKVLQHP